jgi:hypothetical protein
LICTAPWPVASAPCAGARDRDLLDRVETRADDGEEAVAAVAPLLVLSWMLTPSSVMLIAVRGRPLIVAWRLPSASRRRAAG